MELFANLASRRAATVSAPETQTWRSSRAVDTVDRLDGPARPAPQDHAARRAFAGHSARTRAPLAKAQGRQEIAHAKSVEVRHRTGTTVDVFMIAQVFSGARPQGSCTKV